MFVTTDGGKLTPVQALTKAAFAGSAITIEIDARDSAVPALNIVLICELTDQGLDETDDSRIKTEVRLGTDAIDDLVSTSNPPCFANCHWPVEAI